MQGKLQKAKEVMADKLDLPRDVVLDIPKITMVGDRELTIENHKGIAIFEEGLIKINSRLGKISITGDKLEIVFIGGNTLALRGSFNNICYEEKNNEYKET